MYCVDLFICCFIVQNIILSYKPPTISNNLNIFQNLRIFREQHELKSGCLHKDAKIFVRFMSTLCTMQDNLFRNLSFDFQKEKHGLIETFSRFQTEDYNLSLFVVETMRGF